MKKDSVNRSALLLMEIIIAILFFSVVSAVCLQLFVKSHNISRDSEALVGAVNQANSAAEILTVGKNGTRDLTQHFQNMETKDTRHLVYYKEDFQPCASQDEAVYYMEIAPSSDGSSKGEEVLAYDISIYRKDDSSPLYTLNVLRKEPL